MNDDVSIGFTVSEGVKGLGEKGFESSFGGNPFEFSPDSIVNVILSSKSSVQLTLQFLRSIPLSLFLSGSSAV